MRGPGASGVLALEEEGEECIDYDECKQDRYHRGRGAPADSRGASGRGQALLASDESDREREGPALDDPGEDVPREYDRLGLVEVGLAVHVQAEHGDDEASEHPDRVSHEGEE